MSEHCCDLWPECSHVLLLDVARTGSQAEIAAAYAEAIRTWPKGTLIQSATWDEVNSVIAERWSAKSLMRIKREAWRLIDDD